MFVGKLRFKRCLALCSFASSTSTASLGKAGRAGMLSRRVISHRQAWLSYARQQPRRSGSTCRKDRYLAVLCLRISPSSLCISPVARIWTPSSDFYTCAKFLLCELCFLRGSMADIAFETAKARPCLISECPLTERASITRFGREDVNAGSTKRAYSLRVGIHQTPRSDPTAVEASLDAESHLQPTPLRRLRRKYHPSLPIAPRTLGVELLSKLGLTNICIVAQAGRVDAAR